MIETKERDGSSSKLIWNMKNAGYRAQENADGFRFHYLESCLSVTSLHALMQLLKLENHYPMMFGNVAISLVYSVITGDDKSLKK